MSISQSSTSLARGSSTRPDFGAATTISPNGPTGPLLRHCRFVLAAPNGRLLARGLLQTFYGEGLRVAALLRTHLTLIVHTCKCGAAPG